ncbi:unnamed protein product [Leptosia nina]|uniref:Uncharacterized protein n=1 Tax=Leptosia nina TaxID=320188 RepID=A0AAV1JPU5_9NEOP
MVGRYDEVEVPSTSPSWLITDIIWTMADNAGPPQIKDKTCENGIIKNYRVIAYSEENVSATDSPLRVPGVGPTGARYEESRPIDVGKGTVARRYRLLINSSSLIALASSTPWTRPPPPERRSRAPPSGGPAPPRDEAWVRPEIDVATEFVNTRLRDRVSGLRDSASLAPAWGLFLGHICAGRVPYERAMTTRRRGLASKNSFDPHSAPQPSAAPARSKFRRREPAAGRRARHARE